MAGETKSPGTTGLARRSKMPDMDCKLVAKPSNMRSPTSPKHRISAANARAILQRAGRSREKANELAEGNKGR